MRKNKRKDQEEAYSHANIMNITERYFEMCQKAEQIQVLRISFLKKFDYYHENNIVEIAISDACGKRARIWLPRQDQLQEMIKEAALLQVVCKINQFSVFVNRELSTKTVKNAASMITTKGKVVKIKRRMINGVAFSSFEELWLAFVMQQNYNKIWDFTTRQWNEIKRADRQGN